MVKTLSGVTNFTVSDTLKVKKVSANNSLGTLGQVLTTNGSATYWATPVAEVAVNTAAQYVWTNTHIFNANVTVNAALIANGSSGTAGQVLHSNGTAIYWAADDVNVNTTYDLLAVANTEANKGIIRLKDVNNANDDVYVTGAGGVVVSSNASHIVITGQSGDITGVNAGDGLTGTTTSGEAVLSVLANTGIIANATGTYVNAAYIATIASNSSNFANLATYVSTATTTNTFNIGTSTYFLANGNVGIGNSSPSAPFTIQKAGSASTIITKFVAEITGTTGSLFDYDHYNSVDGNGSAQIRFNKANGTIAAPTIVGTDRATGRFGSRGYDGTAFYDNALIRMAVDGAPGTGSMPGRLEFWTTPSGSTTLVERMRITSTGNVGISNTAPADKFSVNGTSYFGANVTLTAALVANGGAGSAGQVLHSNGTATYWAADDNTNTTYDLLTVANTEVNKAIIRLQDSGNANDDVFIIGANGITTSSNSSGAYAYAVGSSTVTVNTSGIHVNPDLTIANLTASYANVTNDLYVGRNVAIQGNLTIYGTSTTLQGNTITFSDNMLYLNQGILATITGVSGNGTYVTFTANNNYQAGWDVVVTGVNPTSYNGTYQNIFSANATHFVVANTNTASYVSGGTARGKTDQNPDLGIAAGYNDGTYHHTGLFRDATDGYWKVFDGYLPEPDASVNIDTSNTSFNIAGFWSGNTRVGNTTVYTSISNFGINFAASGYEVNPTGARFGFYNGGGTPQTYMQMPAGGEIVFWNSGTGEVMRIANNNKVGIGTNNPSTILSVIDNSGIDTQISAYGAANKKAYFRTNSGYGVNQTFGTDDIGGFMYVETDHPFYVSTGNSHIYFSTSRTERMRIAANGNIGIGNSSPSSKLTVNGDILASGDIRSTSAGSNQGNFQASMSGSGAYLHMIRPGYQAWYLASPLNSSDFYLSEGTGAVADHRMFFKSGGNVGIGTSSPSSRLEVVANSTTATALGLTIRNLAATTNTHEFEFGVGYPGYYDNAGVIRFANVLAGWINSSGDWNIATNIGITANKVISSLSSGNAYLNLYDASNNTLLGSHNSMLFSTNGAERMRLDSSGRLLVNLTSAAADSAAIISGANFSGRALTLSGGASNTSTAGQVSLTLAHFGDGSNPEVGSVIRSLEEGNNTLAGSLIFEVFGPTTRSEAMRINSSGNVGIGETNPQRKLTVRGDSNAALTVAAFYNADTTNNNGTVFSFRTDTTGTGAATFQEFAGVSATYEQHDHATRSGRLNFFTVGNGSVATTRMTIANNGNVGIGTTVPSALLHVPSAIYPVALIERTSTLTTGMRSTFVAQHTTTADMTDGFGADLSFRIKDSANVDNEIGNIGARRDGADNSGRLAFYSYLAGVGAENMTIKSDGNVGIGTTAPSAKLDVANGDIRLANNATYIRSVTTGGNSVRMLGINGSDIAYVGAIDAGPIGTIFNASSTSNYIAMYTAGAERVRITSAGNVGIGNTSPAQKLHVYDNTSIVMARVEAVNAGSAYLNLKTDNRSYNIFTENSTSGLVFYDVSQGAERIRLAANGNVGIGTTSPANKLQVDGNVTFNGSRPIVFDTGLGSINMKGSAGGWAIGTFFLGSAATQYGGFGAFGSSDALSYYFVGQAYDNAAIYVTSAGNVGIGLNNPSNKLHVVGTGQFASSVANTTPFTGLLLTAPGGNAGDASPSIKFDIGGGGGGASIYTTRIGSAGGNLIFTTDNTSGTALERMRIDSNGTLTLTGTTDKKVSFVRASANTFSIEHDTSRIYFWNATTANVVLSMTNGSNVGIGLGSPAAKLEVSVSSNNAVTLQEIARFSRVDSVAIGGTIGRAGLISFYDALNGTLTGAVGGIRDNSSNHFNGSLGFYVSNSANVSSTSVSQLQERMRITSDGSVGIGTTSPNSPLHVTGDIFSDDGIEAQAVVAWGTPHSYITGSGGTAGVMLDYTSDVGNIRAFNNSSGTGTASIGFITAGSERVRITSNGDVGIGTTSPLNYSGYTSLTIGSTNSVGLIKLRSSYNSGNGAEIYQGTGGSVWFNTNSTSTWMLSDSAGNVGIGTTSPTSRLNVSGGQIRIQTSGTYSEPAVIAGILSFDSVGGQLTISSRSNGGSTHTAFFTSDSGTGAERVRISANGNVGIGTTTPTAKLDVNGEIRALSISGYNLSNNAATIDTGLTPADFTILEAFGSANPNSDGSSNYRDPIHLYIYKGTGWNGSAVTEYVYAQSIAPPARSAFPSGGAAANENMSVVWVKAGVESDTCPLNDATYSLRIKISNYTTTSYFNLRIVRRF